MVLDRHMTVYKCSCYDIIYTNIQFSLQDFPEEIQQQLRDNPEVNFSLGKPIFLEFKRADEEIIAEVLPEHSWDFDGEDEDAI